MIKPQIPKGFRDFLPQKMIARKKIIEIMSSVFESFGFEPLDTPCLEYSETLEGKYGEEGDRLIYKFQDRGGRSVAMRYDLTIPLSRVVAMYPEIIKPFRRYQIAPVWRADKPQKGRFREFYQCDIDIIGTESACADAELVIITCMVLKKLGLENFTIRINNRKILNAFADKEGISKKNLASFLRTLDKTDKIGSKGVIEELNNKGILNKALEKKLNDFVFCEEAGSIEMMRKLAGGIPAGDEGIRELEIINDSLAASGVSEKHYRFDISLARGLDYYTGPIFETTVDGAGVGSITGGGRYDNLIGLFSNQTACATGTSFGLERLVTLLEEISDEDSAQTKTQVLITLFDSNLMQENLKIAKMLRESGLNTEVYLSPHKLRKQLTYASNRKIPFVVILGSDEISQGKITIKNMKTGTQDTVLTSNAATIIMKNILT